MYGQFAVLSKIKGKDLKLVTKVAGDKRPLLIFQQPALLINTTYQLLGFSSIYMWTAENRPALHTQLYNIYTYKFFQDREEFLQFSSDMDKYTKRMDALVFFSLLLLGYFAAHAQGKGK